MPFIGANDFKLSRFLEVWEEICCEEDRFAFIILVLWFVLKTKKKKLRHGFRVLDCK